MTGAQAKELGKQPVKQTEMQPERQVEKGHWASFDEATFAMGMRFLFWVCRVFGRWPFRLFLYPVLGWYLLARPQARAASADYLRRVREHARRVSSVSAAPVGGSVFGHFASFAESIMDKLLLWSGLFDTGKVALYGRQPLDELIAQGRGCLLICSHLGNLELCRVLSRQRPGLKMTVLVHTRHAKTFNRLLAEIDPASQLNLMQVTEMSPATAMLLSDKVGRGEFVAIAGDRIPVSSTPRVAIAPFLGESAPFPVGPYVLASLLQCPVYLMFSMRTGGADGASEIHFEPFRESVSLPRKGRDDALAGLAADYAARLEHHCLRAPMQWFNFYPFWHLPDTNDKNNHASL